MTAASFSDTEVAARIEASFAEQSFMTTLGARLVAGRARLANAFAPP